MVIQQSFIKLLRFDNIIHEIFKDKSKVICRNNTVIYLLTSKIVWFKIFILYIYNYTSVKKKK